jgi:membrane-bound metal-dependent hydrolase YbcI (DUF457 family)
MTYKKHLAAGVILCIALKDKDISNNVVLLLGTVIPDMDAKYSFIRSKFKIVSKFYDKLPKNAIFDHRGALLHSWLTLIPLLLIYSKTSFKMVSFLSIGIFSHHLLDMIGKRGLRYFYPSRKIFRIGV